jgi:hypothetical protein
MTYYEKKQQQQHSNALHLNLEKTKTTRYYINKTIFDGN